MSKAQGSYRYPTAMLVCRSLTAAVLLLSQNVAGHEPDLSRLPLGDLRKSTAPKAGWLWACQPNAVGSGAEKVGPWIRNDGTYDFTAKAVVDGQVMWPYRFVMSVVDGARGFATNDLPNHPSGVFPIAPGDDAHAYDRNPNSIRQQDMRIELPLNPVRLAQPRCAPGAVGILLTGVALFNGLDALGRDAVAHETQDGCQGHPQRSGTYHYHSVTTCMDDKRLPDGHSALVGYALDGFGIFGRFGEKGQALQSADLDECHGHTHKVEWDGRMVEMYHYHATWDFPYTVGCMRGNYTIEHVAIISGAPPGGRQAGPPGIGRPGMDRPGMDPRGPDRLGPDLKGTDPRGRPNLEEAAARLGIDVDQLQQALGPPPPDLHAAAKRLGISEATLRQALRPPNRL